MIHIYTDASSKDTTMYPGGVLRTTKVGIIVRNSNIIDVWFKRKEKFISSHEAEKQAILDSVAYVNSKYETNEITVHTDEKNLMQSKSIKKLIASGIRVEYVKGHCPRRKELKYKFNCLADWISRNGINSWRNYYYRHLLPK